MYYFFHYDTYKEKAFFAFKLKNTKTIPSVVQIEIYQSL